MQLAFVGGGVMAEAILSSLLKAGHVGAGGITVAEPLAARCADLTKRYGVRAVPDNAEAVRGADVVVLSVKPQVAGAALTSIQGVVGPDALVISIMAGTTIATIRAALGAGQPVVRVMPNTPAQIGEGMSAWTATDRVSAEQRAQLLTVLGSMGEQVEVANEHYIDMATAVNGSGPGYVFLIIEAMIDAAVQLGFMRPVAEKLVLQTLKGSVDYAIFRKTHPAVLKGEVMSAGGTTAAGLAELEKGNLRATMANAILAAFHRAEALGKQ